ncbi:hypothetical protein V1227_12130 [Lentzea sp. DG1S-22]|uniref:DUF6745 domain-containing protein n=1 Tax=Lentzea sp. DG1S-22 TaxID=3108822 RepID=UPI002E76ABCA|nr:hypothetical protein [Lentzea sp. DG1S-22]WVH83457.1 hypothetical protein V1227_12130 [Lentzea sp. DG1S-22]
MSAPSGLEARSPEGLPLHEDWLAHALSTAPADRPAAEDAVARLYAAIGRPPPEFAWVRSPAKATAVLPAAGPFRFPGDWQTTEAKIAALLSGLRRPLWRRGEWKGEWRATGEGLRRIVRESIVPAVNSTMPWSPGIGWSGQHDADWLAEFDARRQLRGPLLDAWATITRSTGWWWPREGLCVMSDRPTDVHTDANSLLHNKSGPAITFADGTGAYAWHGRTVPRWVVEEPDVVRILTEPDADLRMAAADSLGWERYIAEADPPLAARAPDPGNPGFDLELYDLWPRTRILLVVNGSVERDGTRRRYGLQVGPWVRDPVQAAAETYGLRKDQYLQLLRRT